MCRKGSESRGIAYRDEASARNHNGDSRDLKYLRHNRHITFDLRRNSAIRSNVPWVVKTSKQKKKKKKERRRRRCEETRRKRKSSFSLRREGEHMSANI